VCLRGKIFQEGSCLVVVTRLQSLQGRLKELDFSEEMGRQTGASATGTGIGPPQQCLLDFHHFLQLLAASVGFSGVKQPLFERLNLFPGNDEHLVLR
jgi:hypothetical protein